MHYSQEHEWITLEGNIGTVGISAYAVEQLGDITFIEFPEISKEVSQGESAAFIESVKAASDIYTPVSGKIVEVNSELESAPEMVNENPEGAAWIFKIELSDAGEIDSLMDADKYKAFIESL